jgi:sugar lactone lactonase YvrE
VRKVDADGVITTFAGDGMAGMGGDGGPADEASLNRPTDIAFDSDGALYIADTDNSCVRRVLTDGTIETFAGVCGEPSEEVGGEGDGGPAAEARLDRPYGVMVDDDDNLYIADTHNHRIAVVWAE